MAVVPGLAHRQLNPHVNRGLQRVKLQVSSVTPPPCDFGPFVTGPLASSTDAKVERALCDVQVIRNFDKHVRCVRTPLIDFTNACLSVDYALSLRHSRMRFWEINSTPNYATNNCVAEQGSSVAHKIFIIKSIPDRIFHSANAAPETEQATKAPVHYTYCQLRHYCVTISQLIEIQCQFSQK